MSEKYKGQNAIERLFDKIDSGISMLSSADDNRYLRRHNQETLKDSHELTELVRASMKNIDGDVVTKLDDLISKTYTPEFKARNGLVVPNNLYRIRIDISRARRDLISRDWFKGIRRDAFSPEDIDPDVRVDKLRLVRLHAQRWSDSVDSVFQTAVDFALKGSRNLSGDEQTAAWEVLDACIKQKKLLLAQEDGAGVSLIAKGGSYARNDAAAVYRTIKRLLPDMAKTFRAKTPLVSSNPGATPAMG